MLSSEENELLTQTDSSTPMGQFFRRFWQPVALSEELAEADGPPLRVTVLGEELVAFRNTMGEIGLISRRCAHRGADLFFGRNEECGLRCVYHGWKFDVSGKAVDLPNVSKGVALHEKARVKAYPTAEFGGIVWAWLGPKGKVPEIPKLEVGLVTSSQRYVTKQLIECNWAQVMEGDVDASHFSFLHMPAPTVVENDNPVAPVDSNRLRWIRNAPIPDCHILDHPTGFVIGWSRKADEDKVYWRVCQIMLPAHGSGLSALPGETYFGFTVVPINNRACWMYTYAWNPERNIDAEEREKYQSGFGLIAELDSNYKPIRNLSNDFQIDRLTQKTETYTGVRGFAEQDLMIQQSQGYIVDRTAENLAASDVAIVKFRRTLLDGAKALKDGKEPDCPWFSDSFHRRPGSYFAAPGVSFEEVLIDRFGHPRGEIA